MNFEKIEPQPVVCRQSSIACALHCPRKWWCKYRMGITLRGVQVKESADLGKIYHKFQELGPGREQEVKAWIQQQQNALMERVNRGEDLDGQMARKANLMTESYHKAEVMAQIFWEKYPQPSYFKVIGQEIKHTMGWNGLTLEGTIDKLLLNEQDGSIWIRDHKSTGRPLKFLFGGMAWSLQARIYRILAEDFIAKQALLRVVRGFILDGILKPGIKLCRTDEKNAKDWGCPVEEAYLRRVKGWYKEADEKLRAENKDPYGTIHSKAIFYTEPLMPTELETALKVMRELSKRPAELPHAFEKDVTRRACSEYEKQCEYYDLCSTDPEQWDSLFEQKYKFVKPTEDNDAQNEETD